VTVTEPTDRRSHDERAPAELQAAARAAYQQAIANGPAPTGAELGRQFGRSARWGRDRIAEARNHTTTTNWAAAAAPGDAALNGSHHTPPGHDSNRAGSHTGATAVAAGSHRSSGATRSIRPRISGPVAGSDRSADTGPLQSPMRVLFRTPPRDRAWPDYTTPTAGPAFTNLKVDRIPWVVASLSTQIQQRCQDGSH
jgi:hypothetical protein